MVPQLPNGLGLVHSLLLKLWHSPSLDCFFILLCHQLKVPLHMGFHPIALSTFAGSLFVMSAILLLVNALRSWRSVSWSSLDLLVLRWSSVEQRPFVSLLGDTSQLPCFLDLSQVVLIMLPEQIICLFLYGLPTWISFISWCGTTRMLFLSILPFFLCSSQLFVIFMVRWFTFISSRSFSLVLSFSHNKK